MKPRMTIQLRSDGGVPRCPHCDSDAMGEAPITLEQLIDNLPLPDYVAVASDGYVPADWARQYLLVHCPACLKPSALAIDSVSSKLIAARTETDARLLAGAT